MDMKPFSLEQYKMYYKENEKLREENDDLHKIIVRLVAEAALAKADAERAQVQPKSIKAVK